MIHTFNTSIFLVLLSVGISAATARLLGPVELGSYELALATATLLLLVFGLSVSSGVTYVVSRRAANVFLLRKRLLWISLGQALVIYLVAEALSRTPVASAFFSKGSGGYISILISAYALFASMTQHGKAILIGINRIELANRIDMLVKCCHAFLIAGLGCWVLLGDFNVSHRALFTVLVIASILSSAVFWTYARVQRGVVDTSGLKQAMRFAFPGHLANLAQFLNYRLDIFLIGYFVGGAGVGLYALASLVAQLVWLVPRAVSFVLFPRVAATTDDEVRVIETVRAVRVCFFLSVVVSVILGLVASPLLTVMFGAEFRESVPAVLWLLPGVALFSIATILAAFFGGVGKPSVNLVVSVVGLACTLPLALALIPKFGIVGASIASSVSYAASTVTSSVYFRTQTGVSWGDLLIPKRTDLAALKSVGARKWK